MPDDPNEPVIEYFQALIAGKKIEIECKYRDVFRTCREYLTTFDTPDLVIPIVTDEELDYERTAAESVDKIEGHEGTYHSAPALETLSVYRKISDALLDEGYLLFHGAAIAAEGKCYLFMAKSGTGKTTHIRKWLKLHPETFVVNGDKPLIDTNSLLVYGTPWCGKEKFGTNTAVPLGGLIQLERGEVNEIESVSFSDMLTCLMHQTHIPPVSTLKVVQRLKKLQGIPCWHLKCNMDDSAGELTYNTLVKKTGDND